MADTVVVKIRVFGTWRLKVVTVLFRALCRFTAVLNWFGNRNGTDREVALNLHVRLKQTKGTK